MGCIPTLPIEDDSPKQTCLTGDAFMEAIISLLQMSLNLSFQIARTLGEVVIVVSTKDLSFV